MKFPAKIENINDILPFVQDKKEIRVKETDGHTIVCYMISDKDTFDSPASREARGITFDGTGKLVNRPLHKFFNVGEREDTIFESLPWAAVTGIYDKADGSMISTFHTDGELQVKTKKTITGLIPDTVKAWIQSRNNYVRFCEFCTKQNYSPIFEWCSPEFRIVLNYSSDDLKLLHIRDNVTGKYIYKDDIAKQYGLSFTENLLFANSIPDVKEFAKSIKDMQNIEGYIFQFADGDMVKIKTEWYLNLHRTVTFLREVDIAKAVIDETVDDIKETFREQGIKGVERIEQIETDIVQYILNMDRIVTSIVKEDGTLERKDFAIKYKEHPMFNLLMTKYTGNEPDYKLYYAKNQLKTSYGMKQIY